MENRVMKAGMAALIAVCFLLPNHLFAEGILFHIYETDSVSKFVKAMGSDFNSDGQMDVALWSQPATANTGEGVLYEFKVISGKDKSTLFSISGGDENDAEIVSTVDVVNDLNGDEIQDLLILFTSTTPGEGSTLKALSGINGATLYSITQDSPDPEWPNTYASPEPYPVGDIDDDGVDDFALYVPEYNTAEHREAGKLAWHSGIDGSEIHVLFGNSENERFPEYLLMGIGDVNSDGVQDFLRQPPSGEAPDSLILDGSNSDLIATLVKTAEEDRVTYPENAALPDLNGDGYKELLLHVGRETSGKDFPGECRVYSGKDGSILDTVSVPEEPKPYKLSMSECVVAGDIDQDGVVDYFHTTGRLDRDTVYPRVDFRSGSDGSVLFSMYDFKLKSFGDFDNNGQSDLLVLYTQRFPSGEGSGVAVVTADRCPDDPEKLFPGLCGCGLSDAPEPDGFVDCNGELPVVYPNAPAPIVKARKKGGRRAKSKSVVFQLQRYSRVDLYQVLEELWEENGFSPPPALSPSTPEFSFVYLVNGVVARGGKKISKFSKKLRRPRYRLTGLQKGDRVSFSYSVRVILKESVEAVGSFKGKTYTTFVGDSLRSKRVRLKIK
jgi:hypothetical protein